MWSNVIASQAPRHCERSEAIHLAVQRKHGLLRFARNDGCCLNLNREMEVLRRLRHHAVAAVMFGPVERDIGALEHVSDRLALDLKG